MLTFLYFVLGFVVLIMASSVVLGFRSRRIAAERVGENYDTFKASFGVNETPQEVLLATYVWFQKWQFGAFPVRALDNIGSIYGVVEDDLEDAVIEVLAQCGRKLSSEEQVKRMHPIITIRDFALFVAACPKIVHED